MLHPPESLVSRVACCSRYNQHVGRFNGHVLNLWMSVVGPFVWYELNFWRTTIFDVSVPPSSTMPNHVHTFPLEPWAIAATSCHTNVGTWVGVVQVKTVVLWILIFGSSEQLWQQWRKLKIRLFFGLFFVLEATACERFPKKVWHARKPCRKSSPAGVLWAHLRPLVGKSVTQSWMWWLQSSCFSESGEILQCGDANIRLDIGISMTGTGTRTLLWTSGVPEFVDAIFSDGRARNAPPPRTHEMQVRTCGHGNGERHRHRHAHKTGDMDIDRPTFVNKCGHRHCQTYSY